MSSNQAVNGLHLVPNQPARIWERQPKESPEAYEAWQVYIAVKSGNSGGIREVARRLGKSGTLISKWSVRWNWLERYRAYENNELLTLEAEKQRALRKETEKWAERRVGIRERGFELGEALIVRAKNLLALPVFETKVEKTVTAESGEVIDTVTVLNFQQHPRDARLMAETGVKLLRLSADMSTENLGVPVDVDLESMSDEDLEAYIDKMQEMRKISLGAETKK